MTKDNARPETETETECRVGGGSVKTPPQLRDGHEARGLVSGAMEGRRAEDKEEEGEADREGGRGAGEDAAEGRSIPYKSGKGTAEAERVGTNEADECRTVVDAS